MNTLLFYSDPGHGWLEVTRQQLEASGYIPTHCSYKSKTGKYYLEEDCDAPRFLAATQAMQWTIKEVNIDAMHESQNFIRRLPLCNGVTL